MFSQTTWVFGSSLLLSTEEFPSWNLSSRTVWRTQEFCTWFRLIDSFDWSPVENTSSLKFEGWGNPILATQTLSKWKRAQLKLSLESHQLWGKRRELHPKIEHGTWGQCQHVYVYTSSWQKIDPNFLFSLHDLGKQDKTFFHVRHAAHVIMLHIDTR